MVARNSLLAADWRTRPPPSRSSSSICACLLWLMSWICAIWYSALAVGVADGGDAQGHPDDVAVFVDVSFLALQYRQFAAEELDKRVAVGGAIVGVRDRLKGGGHQVLRGVPDHVAQRAVHLQPVSIRRHQGHTDRGAGERLNEALLADAQLGGAVQPCARSAR